MPKATECLISVQDALRLRDLLRTSKTKLHPLFRCRECNRVVRPEAKSASGAAHFEHQKRNLNCKLSDKRTVLLL